MSNRYKGAVISATPPTTTGGESGTASGAWTLEQQMQLQAAGLWPIQPLPKYIEDVFSTYLYTGTGAAQTITNGINLSANGGLVWIKRRDAIGDNTLTVTGNGLNLSSNLTTDFINDGAPLFNSSGFDLVYGTSYLNASGGTYASWTFREQAKFFDIVTYTGSGANRTIAHNLGSEPACIIIKSTNRNSTDWAVYHRSLGNTQYIRLNNTGAAATSSTYWNNTTPTSSVFSLGTSADVNNSGGANYVAYLFAHNAGGFGLTGTDNVISCGSYTGDGSSFTPITLGYEPQWLMVKRSDGVGNWAIFDTTRGMPTFDSTGAAYGQILRPNLALQETTGNATPYPVSTGFGQHYADGDFTTGNFIYIAIRRGPMRVPTVGTSVFSPVARTGTGVAATISGIGFAPDLLWDGIRNTAGYGNYLVDKLRGGSQRLGGASTAAEATESPAPVTQFGNTSVAISNSGTVNDSGVTYVNWFMQRAPSFFDEVCYTGTGAATTQAHNLAAVPEFLIVKRRNAANNWAVYAAPLGNTNRVFINQTQASAADSTLWNNTTPTSSVFTVGTAFATNNPGDTYVAYLFATCAGVSKVGSYTGTGTTLQIDCGFTAGARFVLIKRTDSTGDWYVWDSARGIVAGNDPYLLLNSTAAEVTNTDYVDTYSAGFEISSTAPAAINASGGTYIFLAIA